MMRSMEMRTMNNQFPCAQCPDLKKGCNKTVKCADWYGWFCGEWNKIQVAAERLRKDANEVDL